MDTREIIRQGENNMKHGHWIKAGLAAIMVTAGACSARATDQPKMTPEQQAMMDKAMKLGSPSEGHKALEPMIGKWTAKVLYWMKPGDKAEESTGASEQTWILGGRFVKQDYKGTMMNGMAFEGMGITGYDNIKGEYQTLWLDNMMTGFMLGTGAFDAPSKTIKTGGTFSCPMTGEKNMWYRSEWKVNDNDHQTYSSYGKTPDGKEFKNMVITY